LRVGPPAPDAVKPQAASSGIRVVPTTTQPAARRRVTSSSFPAGVAVVAALPWRTGSPATAMFSLTATGPPASGSSERLSEASIAAASARAALVRTVQKALSPGSRAAIRSGCSRTTSTAERRPSRTAAARSRAVSVRVEVVMREGWPRPIVAGIGRTPYGHFPRRVFRVPEGG